MHRTRTCNFYIAPDGGLSRDNFNTDLIEFLVQLNEAIDPNCLAQYSPCTEHPINVIIILFPGLYVKKRVCALFVRVEIGEELQRGIIHGMMANLVLPVSLIKSQPFITFLLDFKKRIKTLKIKVLQ